MFWTVALYLVTALQIAAPIGLAAIVVLMITTFLKGK